MLENPAWFLSKIGFVVVGGVLLMLGGAHGLNHPATGTPIAWYGAALMLGGIVTELTEFSHDYRGWQLVYRDAFLAYAVTGITVIIVGLGYAPGWWLLMAILAALSGLSAFVLCDETATYPQRTWVAVSTTAVFWGLSVSLIFAAEAVKVCGLVIASCAGVARIVAIMWIRRYRRRIQSTAVTT